MLKPNSEFIQLKAGPILPAAVIYFFANLDSRGFRFRAERDKLFVSGESLVLSQDERQFIQKYKLHLLSLISYCEHECSVVRP